MKPKFKTIHTDKKTHQYNQCKKDFTCANFICRHERSCSAEQPSEFIQCGKAFAYESGSQRHQIKHTGEKHHDCNSSPTCFLVMMFVQE